MSLHLVVAHQTAASEELIIKLKELSSTEPEAEFVLLVPATPLKHLWTWTEENAVDNARQRASDAIVALRADGLAVIESVVGNRDPLVAIKEELARRRKPEYESIIVCTLPAGLSRWLRTDLPNQVRNQTGLVVLSVVGRAVSTQNSRIEARNRPHKGLHDADASDRPTLEVLAQFRETELSCLDGFLGVITEILYDYVSGEPVWLGVGSRPLPFRTLLIPAQFVRLGGGSLTVQLSRRRVLGQPHVEIGEGIPNLLEEQHLYEYFALPFDEVRDIRVLRRGASIPGSEGFVQNIFDEASAIKRP